MMNWSRRFEDPIPMPDGRIIRTIGEAAEYASLPRKTGATKRWQRAAKVGHEAAEHGGPKVRRATIGESENWRGIGKGNKTRPLVKAAGSVQRRNRAQGGPVA